MGEVKTPPRASRKNAVRAEVGDQNLRPSLPQRLTKTEVRGNAQSGREYEVSRLLAKGVSWLASYMTLAHRNARYISPRRPVALCFILGPAWHLGFYGMAAWRLRNKHGRGGGNRASERLFGTKVPLAGEANPCRRQDAICGPLPALGGLGRGAASRAVVKWTKGPARLLRDLGATD